MDTVHPDRLQFRRSIKRLKAQQEAAIYGKIKQAYLHIPSLGDVAQPPRTLTKSNHNTRLGLS